MSLGKRNMFEIHLLSLMGIAWPAKLRLIKMRLFSIYFKFITLTYILFNILLLY